MMRCTQMSKAGRISYLKFSTSNFPYFVCVLLLSFSLKDIIKKGRVTYVDVDRYVPRRVPTRTNWLEICAKMKRIFHVANFPAACALRRPCTHPQDQRVLLNFMIPFWQEFCQKLLMGLADLIFCLHTYLLNPFL